MPKIAIFQKGIAELRRYRFGTMMEGYTPRSAGQHSAFLDVEDTDDEDTGGDRPLDKQNPKAVHGRWVDLHFTTKKNLRAFEETNFQLETKAIGQEAAQRLVRCAYAFLNFI